MSNFRLDTGGGDGHLFRLPCSVVLWGGRSTANKSHWPVWGALPASRPPWVCPRSRGCAFLVYTAQAAGCSAGNCLRRPWVAGPFPGLSRSGSGSRYSTKAQARLVPRSEQLGWPGAWRARSPRVGAASSRLPVPSARFRRLSCAVSLLWAADLWLRPSQRMSTGQNPRKSWLATGSLLTVWERMPSLGPRLPLSVLAAAACLQRGMGRSTAG